MAAGNASFNTFLSTTIRDYRPTLIENIMQHNVVLWMLKEKGFTEELGGSRAISYPLLYAKAKGGSAYSGYDTLPSTPSEGITRSEFDWKFYQQPVVVAGTEEFMNQGKQAIVPLVASKLEQADITIRTDMNTDIVSGDGTSQGGKSIGGLGIAVEDGASWSTYGGIDGSDSDNSWWRNQFIDFDAFPSAGTHTFGDSYNNTIRGLGVMGRMYNNCSYGGNVPDLILTTQTLFEAYENEIQGKMGRVDMTVGSNARRVADAGFQSLTFKSAALVYDDDVPSEEMIFLNSMFMKFVTGKGRNFVNTPWITPTNQEARQARLLWAGNLVVRKRDQLGRVTKVSI